MADTRPPQTHVWVTEAAHRLNVGESTIRKWFDSGRLDGFVLPDSGWRKITVESIDRLREQLAAERKAEA